MYIIAKYLTDSYYVVLSSKPYLFSEFRDDAMKFDTESSAIYYLNSLKKSANAMIRLNYCIKFIENNFGYIVNYDSKSNKFHISNGIKVLLI